VLLPLRDALVFNLRLGEFEDDPTNEAAESQRDYREQDASNGYEDNPEH
jgi:hypothetical protein